MVEIRFYPVGNGDSSQMILNNGKRLLFDYRHLASSEDDANPEIDLKKELSKDLKEAKKNAFDVVAFSHADRDHIQGSTDFFYLEHAKKYQDGDRIKIDELWVPAAMILEEGLEGEDRILRQEARHRLKIGDGIRVFSKPDKLKEWLKDNGLTLNDRKHLITDAGETVPGYTLEADNVEFFVHSPYIKHIDQNEEIARNESAIILHATFQVENTESQYLLVGDSEWEVLEDIVKITKYHKNNDRLKWDLFKAPHHCSYKALSDEKGDRKTIPKPDIQWLLDQGSNGCIIVSSSNPIGGDYKQKLPPHLQAANCYKEAIEKNKGRKFIVTMESPNINSPKPILVKVDKDGCWIKKTIAGAAAIISPSATKPSPRAGG